MRLTLTVKISKHTFHCFFCRQSGRTGFWISFETTGRERTRPCQRCSWRRRTTKERSGKHLHVRKIRDMWLLSGGCHATYPPDPSPKMTQQLQIIGSWWRKRNQSGNQTSAKWSWEWRKHSLTEGNGLWWPNRHQRCQRWRRHTHGCLMKMR